MSTPFFSVIIPSYNSERFLPRCLGQCRRQTFRDFELVITDDASTDGSVTVIRDFIAANPDISVTFLPSAVNHGIGYSKGLGLRHARGEYVVFHDADDWMDDDFLERGHGVLSAKPVDKLRFRIRVLNERTGRVRVRGTTAGTTKWTEAMFHATFFRRAVFVENGIGFDERRTVMEDLYVQAAFNARCRSFLCVPEAAYTFLYREDSTSGFRSWDICRRVELQRDTLAAITALAGTGGDGLPPGDREGLRLMLAKQYYFMLLQYSRTLSLGEVRGYYAELRGLQDASVPGYLRDRGLTLLRDNGEPFAFRAVIFLLSRLERLRLLGPALALYAAASRLVPFQTK